MKAISAKNKGFLGLAITALWSIGMFFLPHGILTEEYKRSDDYNYIDRILGFMYVSPGLFVFVIFVLGFLFGEKNIPQVTVSFYIGISLVLFVFAIEKTEFLPSAIILIVCVLVVTYLAREGGIDPT